MNNKVSVLNTSPIFLPESWSQWETCPDQYNFPMAEHIKHIALTFLETIKSGDLSPMGKKITHPGILSFFEESALETLNFYAQDFALSRYPSFEEKHYQLDTKNRKSLFKAVVELYKEFGQNFPASLYACLLDPIRREDIDTSVMLAFDEDYRFVSRAWDASLHAHKALPISLKIQSIFSQYGLAVMHACACNHRIDIIEAKTYAFHYDIPQNEKAMMLSAFTWHLFCEHWVLPFYPSNLKVHLGIEKIEI
jgi:hypothetical protein